MLDQTKNFTHYSNNLFSFYKQTMILLSLQSLLWSRADSTRRERGTMLLNLSHIDKLNFPNFTNSNFFFPNISENELDIGELDMMIDMFQSDQNTLSEPFLSIIIICYLILMFLAGMIPYCLCIYSWFLTARAPL